MLNQLEAAAESAHAGALTPPARGVDQAAGVLGGAASSFNVSRLLRWGSQGFWAISDQGLFAVSNLLVNVMLARWLPPAEYGAFATVYTILLLVNGAHSALLIEPMMIFGPDRYRDSFSAYLNLLVRYHWRLMIAISACLGMIATGLILASQQLLGYAVAGLIMTAPFYQFGWLARRACYVVSNPRLAAVGGAINLALTLVGTIALARLDLLSVLSASALLGGTSLVASLAMMQPMRRITSLPLSETARAAIWPAHWKYGRWAGAIGPLVWLQATIYYFVLPIWGGLPATGAFKALMNLAMPILQSDGALATLLTPAFVRERRQRGGLTRIMALSSAGFALEALVYGIVLVVFGDRLLDWLYGGAYRYDSRMLVLLALMPMVASQAQVLGCALRAREQPKTLFWAAVASAVVVDTLGIAAAVTRGVEGALLGSFMGGAAQIAVMIWFFRRPAPTIDAS